MAYKSDIGNALLLCSYLHSAEYVSVNITSILSCHVDFILHELYPSVQLFLLVLFSFECGDLGPVFGLESQSGTVRKKEHSHLSFCCCIHFEFCNQFCSFSKKSILVNMSLYK